MKLPLIWLKEYIDPRMATDKLAEALTMSGSKVEGIENKLGEPVIEIEVTTNRPDCLSLLGLANEVAALSGKVVKIPGAYKDLAPAKKNARTVDITIEDKRGCPRYTARVIEGVRVAPAPEKIRKVLELMGTRPISNVVDATNFVLFESGQPLHAFDLDKLRGGRIVVRRSRKGEKFLGIDGVEVSLDEETLVIADASGPVAIAGVMGGKLTEVTDQTTNILLESAFFDPASVRKASKKYKITSESSYRFERRVNPDNVPYASQRAAELIIEWAGGRDTSALIDKDHQEKGSAGKVTLRLDRMEKVLGMKIPQTRVSQIFRSLSLETHPAGNKVILDRTGFRDDLKIEEDMIEEVLRIEGFEKIPSLLPWTNHTAEHVKNIKKPRVQELKRFLAARGLSEMITYSLLSEKILLETGYRVTDAVRITNAVSAEQGFLRPSLLSGALQTAVYNLHRKAASGRFFELGKRFSKTKEETALGVILYGELEENWKRRSPMSFYDLKGVVESVLAYLKIEGIEWHEMKAGPVYRQGVEGFWHGEKIATFGCLASALLNVWDIPTEVFYAEVALDAVLAAEPPSPRLKALPKYPSARRDVAFVADEKILVHEFEKTIRRAAGPSLQEVVLFDEYKGKGIAPGKRSLAFSLSYQKETGTFTEDEIQALQSRVMDALKAEYAVEFRS